MNSKVNIVEIFESIQGEGRYVGVRQLFVRVAGCPLKCPYCDTDHAAKESFTLNGVEYKNPVTSDSLVKILNKQFNLSEYHSISFTGGEPLLYPLFLKEIAEGIKSDGSGVKLFLETSGHHPKHILDIAPYFDYISVDLKTCIKPFAAHADNLLSALGLLHESKVYIKLVLELTDEEYIDIAIKYLSLYGVRTIWLQTIDNNFDMATISRWQKTVANNKIEARFVPQIHKLLQIP
ncbi:MAG: 7-carboxy-7-deazaguanine synthase QueE [Deferribacteraceae bacterium]|jgi:organic radical activating enzyme|nr:7-carboxy-7-deazaguanine synthase QueE [Deferribacteraceae bacterium]